MATAKASLGERELRIAPVMTGGTSLAVWMGGATTELYRLLRSHPDCPDLDASGGEPDAGMEIYRSLLRLTATKPVVDVLTGTSAGGLNSTLLAAATALDVTATEFGTVRDTWMDVADLEGLLRSAHEPNPPSLLKGDDYFVPRLKNVLEAWGEVHPTPDDPRDLPTVDLVATVTTVRPIPSVRADDFGELIPESSHAETARFRSFDFAQPDWSERLAIVARTSASIPGVFEPSFMPVGKADAAASERPDFSGNVSFGASRWAMDGGVVVNLPLTEAIDRIYAQEASGVVRRVVLYVSPTPPQLQEATADSPAEPPDIRQTLVTTVLAPRAEGIASDLDEIAARNAQIDRQEQARRSLGPLVESAEQASVFDPFRRTRARTSLDRMLRNIRTAKNGDLPLEEAELRQLLLPERLALLPATLEIPDDAGAWPWGIAAVEEAVSVVLGLIARTEQLIDTQTPPGDLDLLDRGRTIIHEARGAVADVRVEDEAFWERQYRMLPTAETAKAAKAMLGRWIDTAFEGPARTFADVPAVERWIDGALERSSAAEADKDLIRRWATSGTVETPTDLRGVHEQLRRQLDDLDDRALLRLALVAWLEAAYDLWPNETPRIRGVLMEKLVAALGTAAEALRTAAPAIRQIASRAIGTSGGDDAPLSERQLVAWDVGQELDRFADEGGETPDALALRRQLLRVHVAQTLVLGSVVSREQRVEIMQVSSNSGNGLDERRHAQDKLAGPELGRLGAFVKPSWRANDWFWGRMDSAARLVLLMLDPARLRQLGHRPETVIGELERITGEPIPDDARRELRFLRPSAVEPPVPRSLPKLSAHVARRLQLVIAREELPRVADAIERSKRMGGNEVESLEFSRSVARATQDGRIPDVEIPGLVKKMRIGAETVRSEFGFGLMNRLASRISAVVANAVTGDRSGIPVVPRFVRPLRAPLQGVNSVVSLLTNGTQLARALTAVVIGVAGAIVALRIAGVDTFPGLFAISAILLIGLVVGAMFRSGFIWLGVCLGVAATLIALTLAGPDLESVVYSKADATDDQLLPENATIELPSGSVLHLESGDDDVVDETAVPDGATAELRNGQFTVVETTSSTAVAGWKKWGFLTRWSVFRFFIGGLVVLLVYGVARQWGRRKESGRLGLVVKMAAWVVGGVIVIGYASQVFETLLTGTVRSSAGGLHGVELYKFRVVDAAKQLHGYELPIVLTVIVVGAVLLAIGTDLATSRTARRIAAAVRHAPRGAQQRLRELVGQAPDGS